MVDRSLQESKTVFVGQEVARGWTCVANFERWCTELGRYVERDIAATLGETTALIPAEIKRDGVKPGFHRSLRLEIRGFEIGANEGLLDDVARGSFVAKVAEDEMKKRLAMTIDQFVQRRVIA